MDNVKTGILIAKKRKEKQLTQKDLADKLGVSNATVSKWETGKGFPDISLIEPLASALEISVSEVLSGLYHAGAGAIAGGPGVRQHAN